MKLQNIKKAAIEGRFLEKSYLKIKKSIIKNIKKIKKIIINCITGKYRKSIFGKIDKSISKFANYLMSRKSVVANNKILFVTSRGSFNCNPRSIAEEIIAQKLPWDLVWVCRKENLKQLESYPKELKLVVRGSYEFHKEAATAKIWIDNSINLAFLNVYKKKEQVLIETWHGSIGGKRFDTSSNKDWIKKAYFSGRRTDYCISNSSFESNLFQTTFWKDVPILKYGHARNDILLTDDENRKQALSSELRKAFGIPDKARVALYAPTFRDNNSIEVYNIDYSSLRDALSKRFGGEWCILSRLHFVLRAKAKSISAKYPGFVIDVTNYRDIQDIMLITDVGITDYSSWIYDFVLTKRPGFLYALDLKRQYNERGFYYPLSSTPFTIAENDKQLADNILNFDFEAYEKKCDEFIKDKGCIDDGHAAQRVVEKLKEIIEQGERR